MINFYWPFRSLNLEKNSDVRKRLKYLTTLINDKNAMMDYSICIWKGYIEADIRFLKGVLKNSAKKPNSKNELKEDENSVQITLNSGLENSLKTTKTINNTKTDL